MNVCKYSSIILLSLTVLGCSTVKIPDPNTGKNLAEVKPWKGEPATVYVVTLREYFGTESKFLRRAGSAVQFTAPYLAVGALLANPELMVKHNVDFNDVIRVVENMPLTPRDPLRPNGAIAVERKAELGTVLEHAGLQTQPTYSASSMPDYFVLGEFKRDVKGSTGLYLIWDVIMAIPAAILPVPIMNEYDYTIEIVVYSADKKRIGSKKIESEMHFTMYSLWSAVSVSEKLLTSNENAGANVAMEIIHEHQKKLSN